MNALSPFSCATAGLPTVDDVAGLLRRRFAPLEKTDGVPLGMAAGRVLAGAVPARRTMPPCDRSAMDGYAYRFCDTGSLRLVGRAPAGAPFAGTVGAGECVAIGTGGALPPGCDTVAMHENCGITPDGIIAAAKNVGANVRRHGEDFLAGDVLLSAGTRLTSRHIGLLAAAGLHHVPVRPQLRIALFSIGDELDSASPGGIADANRPMLEALCKAQGMTVTDLGILPDCRETIASALINAVPGHDAIVCSAGSCTGDEDHARGALLMASGELIVAGAAIKPGKPVSFGGLCGKPCILLPGNPAAAYVTFLALGLPLLRHLSDAPHPVWQTGRAAFAFRKKPGLREYIRIGMRHGIDGTLHATKAGDDAAAMLHSLAAADGLAMLSEEVTDIREGDLITVISFAALEAA